QPGLVDRAHVAAGAEGAVAGAANGDGMHRRVRSPSPHSRIDAPVVVEGQRVERPWPVDDQRGKAALSANQDLALAAHRSRAERPAELPAFEQVVARRLEASAPPAKGAGRYVETAAVEPRHRDFEAVAFLAETIGDRDAAILEDHHRGRLRVPAELFLLFAER